LHLSHGGLTTPLPLRHFIKRSRWVVRMNTVLGLTWTPSLAGHGAAAVRTPSWAWGSSAPTHPPPRAWARRGVPCLGRRRELRARGSAALGHHRRELRARGALLSATAAASVGRDAGDLTSATTMRVAWAWGSSAPTTTTARAGTKAGDLAPAVAAAVAGLRPGHHCRERKRGVG
jgi:hypothetical protein